MNLKGIKGGEEGQEYGRAILAKCDLSGDQRAVFDELGGFLENDWVEESLIDEAVVLNPLFGWNIQEVKIKGCCHWYMDTTCHYNERVGDLVVIFEELDNNKVKELGVILQKKYPGIVSKYGCVCMDSGKLGLFLDHTKAIEIIAKRLLGYIERDQAAKENPENSEKNVDILEKSGWEKIGFWCCGDGDLKDSSEVSSLTTDDSYDKSRYQSLYKPQ